MVTKKVVAVSALTLLAGALVVLVYKGVPRRAFQLFPSSYTAGDTRLGEERLKPTAPTPAPIVKPLATRPATKPAARKPLPPRKPAPARRLVNNIVSDPAPATLSCICVDEQGRETRVQLTPQKKKGFWRKLGSGVAAPFKFIAKPFRKKKDK